MRFLRFPTSSSMAFNRSATLFLGAQRTSAPNFASFRFSLIWRNAQCHLLMASGFRGAPSALKPAPKSTGSSPDSRAAAKRWRARSAAALAPALILAMPASCRPNNRALYCLRSASSLARRAASSATPLRLCESDSICSSMRSNRSDFSASARSSFSSLSRMPAAVRFASNCFAMASIAPNAALAPPPTQVRAASSSSSATISLERAGNAGGKLQGD
mmetsp:Transcript_13098/g.34757  ORF Transcript_13098/g.34757 Transcript_13098/m.34757 type:complete len:217 (-) Transcript_13098:128-778(-)